MEQVLLYCLQKKVGDWTIRIDQPHGQRQFNRKHVHISKKGLPGEYSWNEDGTRHDKLRFPASGQCIEAAKRHASTALGIPVSSLQFLTAESGGTRMSLISNLDPKTNRFPFFAAYIPVKIHVVIFGSPNGLVLVLESEA